MSDDTLKTLKVEITGDASKLKKAAKDAVDDVKKMSSEINREVRKASQIPPARRAGSVSGLGGYDDYSTMAQIRRMNEMIRGMFRVPSLDTVKAAASSIGEYVRNVQVAAGIRVPTEEWSETEAGIERCTASLDRLLEKEAQLKAAGADQKSKSWQGLQYDIQKAKKELDQLYEKAQRMEAEGGIKTGVDKNSKSWKSLQYDIQKTQEKLDQLEAEEAKMESQGTASDNNALWKKLQAEITKTEKALARLRAREEKMQALDADKESASWRKLQAEIAKAETALTRLQEREGEMQAVGADKESTSWRKLQAEIARAGRELDEYKQEKARLESTGGDTMLNVGSGAAGRMRSILAAMKEITSRIPLIGRLASGSGKLFSAAFNGMRATLKKVGPAIKSAGGAFASLIKRFVSGIPGINRTRRAMNQMGNAGKGLGGMLRTIGISAKFMLASFLISSVLSGVGEGMQNLAQYSSQTNASLSALMSSMTQLKNSFATAFAPILNVAVPYLNVLIQKVADAVSAVGMLFASLTGQKIFVRAKQVNQDYAASLNQNAASANAANEANKELQQTILGFDEINKLNDSSSGGTGSTPDTGTSGLLPSDMFEEVPIEPQVNEFAQKLKDAWRKADFTEIGTIVGDKLNSALNSIPWEKIQATCGKIAKSAATFLNGFFSSADWPLVGRTISTGINTAFETANTFARNFNWQTLGSAVGNGINGAVAGLNWTMIRSTVKNVVSGVVNSINSFMGTANWEQIGSTITRFFGAKLLALYTSIQTFSWSDFGKSFGGLINGAIEGIDADMLADTLSGVLNGLAEALRNFDKTIKWGELSYKLYNGINRFLKMTNWKELGEALSSFVKHLLEEITDTIEGTDWEAVGTSIGDFLVGIDWVGVLGRVADAIKAAAKALPQVALGLLDAIKEGMEGMTADDWMDVAESLFTILASALALKALVHGPKIAAAMLGNTIKNAFKKPAQELGESIAKDAYGKFSEEWENLSQEKQTASSVFGGVGGFFVNAGVSALTTSMASDLLREINGTADKSREIDAAFAVIGEALENAGEAAGISGMKISDLARPMFHMAREDAPEFTEAFQEVVEGFEDAGGSSQVFKQCLEEALGDGTQISAEYADQIRQYIGTLSDIPAEASTEIQLDIQEALDNANGYETSLVGIPSSVATSVQAETSEATKKVSVFKSMADKLGLTKYKTTFEAITDSAKANVKALTGETELAAGIKKIRFEAQTKDAEDKIENTGEKVDDVKEKSKFSLDVDTSSASSGLDLFTTLKLLVMRALLSMKLTLSTKDATEALETFHQQLSEVVKEKTVVFKADISAFTKIKSTMYDLGQGAATAFKNGMKSVHIPTPHMYVSSWSYHDLGSGGYSYTPNYSVQWYREGGPVSGEIWGMNEAGNPEMIGTVGNKTAVANNEMITEAIKGAVVDGMMEVFLATRAGNGGEGEAPTVEVVVKADDETLYRRVMKGKKKAERRYQVVAKT